MKFVKRMSKMKKTFVKSFEQIPGPKSFPVIGTLLNYLPLVGKYRFDELHINGLKKYEKYGKIVREEIVPGTNIVWIFTPEDIQELFRKEGRYPQRRSHLALEHYRINRKDFYNTGGLLPTNGPEWHRLRSSFQKGLSSPRNVLAYLPSINDVIDDFITYVSKVSDKENFLPDLSRVFLEMLGLVAFDCRLKSFSAEELKPESMSSQLMEAALTINSCILKTDNGFRLWRFFDTPMYKNLKRAHQYIEKTAVSLVNRKIEQLKSQTNDSEAEKSLLETYLTSKEIDFKDVIGMSADMLLAGIDTITYSTSFVLYHLATNVQKQEKLFEESRHLLHDLDSPVNVSTLAKADYLKAVIKESFRLNPISVGVGRILCENAVFSGYEVPKGNIVVTQNQVVCRLKEYFPEPLAFKPERWFKSCEDYRNINPYLVLPFGHGPRTCIARRLAEQNMQTLILKLCRNFNIYWNGDVLVTKSHLINKPDGLLKFSFKQRSE